jgi:ParB family chromosome partitioning protein
MKLDVLKKQGKHTDLTSAQVAPKLRSDDLIAEETGESCATIQRFVRLTNLIKPLLDMVDAGKIALTPAEKLSYLKKEEQETLAMTLEDLQVTPSLSQAVAMKDHSSKGVLGIDEIYAIMEKPKANQKETMKFKAEPFRKYFPNQTPQDIEKELLKIIEEWKQLKQEKALRMNLRERGDDRER